MEAQKTEWERLIDDSHPWHRAHRLMFWLIVAAVALALLVDLSWRIAVPILFPFWFGFLWRERWMVRRAREEARKAMER